METAQLTQGSRNVQKKNNCFFKSISQIPRRLSGLPAVTWHGHAKIKLTRTLWREMNGARLAGKEGILDFDLTVLLLTHISKPSPKHPLEE